MNSNQLTKLVLCAAVIAALGLAGCADKGKDQNAGAATVAEQPSDQVVTPAAPAAQDVRVSEYLCRQGDDCKSNALAASSSEEAAWLQANGYPSSAELARLQKLSDSQLKTAADAGSVTALAVYGERLALGNDTKNGLDALRKATERGSIYAYYGLSNVYAERKGLKNIVDSGAYLRVAYMLGDSKAGTALLGKTPPIHPVEMAAIDRTAASLYQTYANNRPPRPRPI